VSGPVFFFWRGRTFGFVEIRRGGRGQLNLLHIEIRFAGKLGQSFGRRLWKHRRSPGSQAWKHGEVGRTGPGDTSASMRQVSARDINGLVLVSECVEDGLQVIRPGIPVSL
jgi:hypothetical protein